MLYRDTLELTIGITVTTGGLRHLQEARAEIPLSAKASKRLAARAAAIRLIENLYGRGSRSARPSRSRNGSGLR